MSKDKDTGICSRACTLKLLHCLACYLAGEYPYLYTAAETQMILFVVRLCNLADFCDWQL